MVRDYDDEQTLEEEEAMSNGDSVGNELDDLQKVCPCNICNLVLHSN